MSDYKVMAGEGEVLHTHGVYATLRGARNGARRASCCGDKHAVIYRDTGLRDTFTGRRRWEEIERIS